ncbi:hypothetical protein DOTSEDRAFT_72965 [Dothistroma septosporum NZE10]|uniref:Uncharacterized protein n=1 Tax=Dothistroma septosporum (strain NZE10 / CBS 128990) TaxID=675120 RepID=N1PKF4_DOTSN|nr:hypothetical protein DOTSEDRAFT_72965 [Dothistroma septosporum NZE10]
MASYNSESTCTNKRQSRFAMETGAAVLDKLSAQGRVASGGRQSLAWQVTDRLLEIEFDHGRWTPRHILDRVRPYSRRRCKKPPMWRCLTGRR